MSTTGIMYTLLKGSRRAFTTVAQSVSDANITWAALERQYVSYKLILGIAGVAAGTSVYASDRVTESQIVKAKADFHEDINKLSHGIDKLSISMERLDNRLSKMETDMSDINKKFMTIVPLSAASESP